MAVSAQHRTLSGLGRTLQVLCSAFCHPSTRQHPGHSHLCPISLSKACLAEVTLPVFLLGILGVPPSPAYHPLSKSSCAAEGGKVREVPNPSLLEGSPPCGISIQATLAALPTGLL